MARQALLNYLKKPSIKDKTELAAPISSSADGIPFGWILCFGGRNFWEPDDHVEDRGGAAAVRDRFETPIEVAEARLTNAINVFEYNPHLWVWMASLQLLRSRLVAKGKKGFIRLDAVWAFEKPEQRQNMNRITAYAENFVNLVSTERFAQLSTIMEPLDMVAPFMPRCEPADAKHFRKAARLYPDYDEATAAAALLIGVPLPNKERFPQQVASRYQEEFAKLKSLPPYPSVQAPGAGASQSPKSSPAEAESARGLLARLKGLVGGKQ